jgi:pyruvate formate lyase activating enzyme
MSTRREFIAKAAISAGAVAAATCLGGAAPASTCVRARYWHEMGDAVKCDLCPNACLLQPDQVSTCRVRQNKGGVLVTNGYANPCSVHTDPIEKKPLYHVLPGAKAFSIAVAGCNFRCKNCQNYTISQVSPLETSNEYLPPEQVVEQAKSEGARAIAYTYSEPTVWFEYMYDTAKLARQAGLRNVMVSNGYMNEGPMADLAKYMDAMNVDLKGFDEQVYHKLNAGNLPPILNALKVAHKNGVWIEVGTLVVPQWSDNLDNIRKMCAWIRENLGEQTPFHLLRFFPLYQLSYLFPTSTETLVAAQKIAHEEGLVHVYIGNVAGMDQNTYCPSCKTVVVRREGYLILGTHIKNGGCEKCGAKIAGIWA